MNQAATIETNHDLFPEEEELLTGPSASEVSDEEEAGTMEDESDPLLPPAVAGGQVAPGRGNIFKRTWRRFKHDTRFGRWFIGKHDHYQRAYFLSMAVMIVLLPFLIAYDGFASAHWFLKLFTIPAFVASCISGAKYIAVIGDSRTTKKEKIGAASATLLTIVGIPLVCALLHIDVPMEGTFLHYAAASGVFAFRVNDTVGGFLYRVGGLLNDSRPTSEKRTVFFSALLFAGVGAAIGAKATSIVTCSAGIPLIPAVVASAIAVIPSPVTVLLVGFLFARLGMAAGEYVAKTVNYYRYVYYTEVKYKEYYHPDKYPRTEKNLIPSPETKKFIERIGEKRKWEYRLTAVGTLVGIGIGLSIAIPALPFLALGIVGAWGVVATVAVATLTVMALVTICGSIFSNAGRYGDPKESATQQSDSPEHRPLLHPESPGNDEPGNSHATTLTKTPSPPDSPNASSRSLLDGSLSPSSTNGDLTSSGSGVFDNMAAKFSNTFAKLTNFFKRKTPEAPKDITFEKVSSLPVKSKAPDNSQAVPTPKPLAVTASQSSTNSLEKMTPAKLLSVLGKRETTEEPQGAPTAQRQRISPQVESTEKVLGQKRKLEKDALQSTAKRQEITPVVESLTQPQAASATKLLLPVKMKQEETQPNNQIDNALSAEVVHKVGMFKHQALETMPKLDIAALMHNLPAVAPQPRLTLGRSAAAA